jgi:hypothetical protein
VSPPDLNKGKRGGLFRFLEFFSNLYQNYHGHYGFIEKVFNPKCAAVGLRFFEYVNRNRGRKHETGQGAAISAAAGALCDGTAPAELSSSIADRAKRIWEQVDAFGNMNIWQMLLGF